MEDTTDKQKDLCEENGWDCESCPYESICALEDNPEEDMNDVGTGT